MLSAHASHPIIFAELVAACPARLEKIYQPYVARIPARTLQASVSYALENRGKYLRPLMTYACGYMFAADFNDLDIPASAVELIHTYSLIHDDLPCMDNADLRRGQATCHKKFSESIAVLTGDALQTMAFQIIAEQPSALSAAQRLAMLKTLAQASGCDGIAAGQILDITAMHTQLSLAELETIYRLKTAALFKASLLMGYHAANYSGDEEKLLQLSETLGLAFQIQDDLLDAKSNTSTLGKPQGIDEKNHKITYVTLMGTEVAEKKVTELYEQAMALLATFGEKNYLLTALIKKIIVRNY